jgi:hypothetical protein
LTYRGRKEGAGVAGDGVSRKLTVEIVIGEEEKEFVLLEGSA